MFFEGLQKTKLNFKKTIFSDVILSIMGCQHKEDKYKPKEYLKWKNILSRDFKGLCLNTETEDRPKMLGFNFPSFTNM